ncbi:MAG: bifunctional metallophosphatase/5'-nucleotidase [Oscillospiraceae bacterium]|nr:bifunctional metallophosphatase/5'-nucleotidase [Oscillospiraceae bacterium]
MANCKTVTLLHSNDMHGDFLAAEVDSQLIGGVSMLSGYISQVRREEKNTIYCIAGDMFRGSVIDSEFRGISTIEIMNMLSPDVVTIGNHETDYGIAHLLFIEKCAKFPIINANLHITTNNARLFRPHYILEIDGMKILFIGILTESVLSQTRHENLIGTFVDIHEAAQEVARICNAYNALDIDCTVLLTHIGFEEDKQLAAQLDPALGVDLIIGGHSHTFLEQAVEVNGIVIAHAGTGTDQIGRFDLEIDTDSNSLHSYRWQSVPITGETCPKDLALEDVLTYYKDATDRIYSRVVTRLKRCLTHPDRNRETELGNLLADILQESLSLDLMLLGSGSIRGEALGPLVLLADLTECFPYDDAIHLLRVSGRQLKQMIRFMLRDAVWEGAHCEFYQFSRGMRVVYSRASREFREFALNGAPIEDQQIYKVGLQHYHFMNLESFFSVTQEDIATNGAPAMIASSCQDILEEYLSSHQNLDRTVCGRLVVE